MRWFLLIFSCLFLMNAAPAQPLSDALTRYIATLPPGIRVSMAAEALDPDAYWSFFHRADVPTRSASLIKLPIMAEVMCLNAEGRFDLDEIHILLTSEKTGGSGQLQTYPHRSRITYAELLREMIVQSDNTATNIFIDEIGMPAINARMRSFGLTQSSLARKMMDTTAAQQGRENRVTAREMNALLRKIYAHKIATPAHCAQMLTILKACEDSLTIPAGLPVGTIIAHKTGTLPGLRADAAIVYAPRPFLLTVLVEGARTDAEAEKIIVEVGRMVDLLKD